MSGWFLRAIAAMGAWTVLASGGVMAVGGEASPTATPRTEPRDIVLITVASLRFDRLGCYTPGRRRTPGIDALAESGVRFDRAYTASVSTGPAAASLLTGLYPARHGLRHDLGGRVKVGVPTVAERLSQAGYRTGAVLGSSYLDSDRGLERGFATYDDDIEGVRKKVVGRSRERRAEEATSTALRWLDRAGRDRPLFLWLDYFDPHYDYDPPESQKKDEAGDPYGGEIAYLDAQIDAFVKGLKARGRAARTHLILVGLHGEGLGDHGETGHGFYLYETTVRVPLILLVANGTRRNGVADVPVSLVDVAPTILDLAGIAVPRDIDGRSFLPVLPAGTVPGGRGTTAPRQGDPRRLYVEAFAPYAAYGWSALHAVIEGDRKVVTGARREAFDLAKDPGERSPLGGAPPWAGEMQEFGRSLLGSLEVAVERRREVRTRVDELAPPWNYSPICLEKLTFPDPRDRVELNDPLFRARSDHWQGIVGRAQVIADEEILPRDPSNFTGLDISGFLALRNGWDEYLLHSLELMQCNYPYRGAAYHYFGHHLERKGEHERAEQAFRLFALIEPDNEEAHYDLAVLYARMGKPDRAFESLALAISNGAEDLDHIRRDHRLKSLHGDSRFSSLVGPVSSN